MTRVASPAPCEVGGTNGCVLFQLRWIRTCGCCILRSMRSQAQKRRVSLYWG